MKMLLYVAVITGLLLRAPATIVLDTQVIDSSTAMSSVIPEAAPPDDVKEVARLLQQLAQKHCENDSCAYGVTASTSVVPIDDQDRHIPASLTVLLNEKNVKPLESYLGMILEFSDVLAKVSIRITIIDRGLDGDVDLMIKQSVVPRSDGHEDQLEEKACYSSTVPNPCKTELQQGQNGMALDTYREAVGSMLRVLKEESQKRGLIKI